MVMNLLKKINKLDENSDLYKASMTIIQKNYLFLKMNLEIYIHRKKFLIY